MKTTSPYLILLIIALMLFGSHPSYAQSTFQLQFSQPDSASSFESFDSQQTPDGGFVSTGLASEGSSNTFHPFILKLDCLGKEEWRHFFGNSQTIGNIFPKVIVTQDSGYVLINNIGVYNNYNGLAVRLSRTGNILWQKTLNLSSGNDIISDVTETADGHLLITGASKSTPDVSLTKLNSDGSLVWNKTFGSNGQYDEGSALIETKDGGYLITGRYISMLTFNALLLKTDSSGNLLWLKCYGDTNQHMWGFDIKELKNNDLVMVGSTTLLKPSYSSYADNFIMRLNSNGDTLWTKIFYGNPDLFENASSVELDDQENFIIGVATASYPTAGFVPNKHAVIKFSASGQLLKAKTFNDESSHYPRLSKCRQGGFLLSGFSNAYTGPIGFQTLFLKMDSNLSSGCFESDVTTSTNIASVLFKITQPIPLITSSGNIANNTGTWLSSIRDSVLCANFPAPKATIHSTLACAGFASSFFADSTNIVSCIWDFGDVGNGDSANTFSANYIYTSQGTYTVTLIVSNGCQKDTATQIIMIQSAPLNLNLGPDQEICIGSQVNIGTTLAANSFSWNTTATTPTITVSQSGTYILGADIPPCGFVYDTIDITFINCDSTNNASDCEVFIPSAFSPNGDTRNDFLKPLFKTGLQDIEYMRFEIFNRWGNLVYSSSNPNVGWDGKHNGMAQNIDSYYYFFRYRCKKEIRLLKGDVVLVR